jgi:uncharacterized phage-associated protein
MKRGEGIKASEAILRILAKSGEPVPSTKLVKLTYLVDYLHYQHYGRTLTGFEYTWDHFGPNAVGLAIIGEAEALVMAEQAVIYCVPNIHGGQTNYFKAAPNLDIEPLSDRVEMLIDDIIQQYGGLSIEDVTEITKRTEPFRNASRYSILSMKYSAPIKETGRAIGRSTSGTSKNTTWRPWMTS